MRHNFAKIVLENELNTTWFDFIFGSLSLSFLMKTNIRSADLLTMDKASAALLSLAYHHGYLTYADPITDSIGKLVCPNLEFRRLLLETLLLSEDKVKLRSIINNILLAEEKKDDAKKEFYKQQLLQIGVKWLTPELLQLTLKHYSNILRDKE